MNMWPNMERSVDLVKPDGQRVRFTVQFGPVYQQGADFYCPVRFDGWGDSPPDIEGRDALQAFLDAVQLVKSILHRFVVKGGKVLWPDSDIDYDLTQLG